MVTSSPTRECGQCGFGLGEGSSSQTGVSHPYSAAQEILLLPRLMWWGKVETIQEKKETSVSQPDAALLLSWPQFSGLAVTDEPNF